MSSLLHLRAATSNLLAQSATPAAHHAAHAARAVQHALHPGPHHGLVHFFFHFGIAGLPLVSAVDSSFVPLPIPGVTDIMLILFAAGHANIYLLVFLATLGSAIGGLFSHAVGQAGGMAFLKKHISERTLHVATSWMERHAVLSVALPALLPPPMPLSPFVLVAGAVKMSRKTFMIAFTVSRFLRHCVAVWIGIRYGHGFLRLWSHFNDKWANTFLISVWTLILLSLAFAIWKLYGASKQFRPSKSQQPTTT